MIRSIRAAPWADGYDEAIDLCARGRGSDESTASRSHWDYVGHQRDIRGVRLGVTAQNAGTGRETARGRMLLALSTSEMRRGLRSRPRSAPRITDLHYYVVAQAEAIRTRTVRRRRYGFAPKAAARSSRDVEKRGVGFRAGGEAALMLALRVSAGYYVVRSERAPKGRTLVRRDSIGAFEHRRRRDANKSKGSFKIGREVEDTLSLYLTSFTVSANSPACRRERPCASPRTIYRAVALPGKPSMRRRLGVGSTNGKRTGEGVPGNMRWVIGDERMD